MKSFFLCGPRATGKTTLIKRELVQKATLIDLLDSRYFLRLSSAPYELKSIIAADPAEIVVIDEIQRVPELLNEIHRLIGFKNLTFLLTGSSARKLRRGQANLLAGRVWESNMFPLIHREIPDFNLHRYLNYWRSKNGHEVDFLIGTRTAIEVKASKKISGNDFKGLKYLSEEGVFQFSSR